jgi:hypothetical protein
MVIVDETPEAFEAMVHAAFGYLNERPELARVLQIGSWNEWTEGHYMLPDTRWGEGYLQALARALAG